MKYTKEAYWLLSITRRRQLDYAGRIMLPARKRRFMKRRRMLASRRKLAMKFFAADCRRRAESYQVNDDSTDLPF